MQINFINKKQFKYIIPSLKESRDKVLLAALKKKVGLRLNGSMTVEACFVVPIFIFVLFNILFAIEMIRLDSNLCVSLHQAGNKAAYTAYAREKALPDIEIAEDVLTGVYARSKIISYLGSDYLNNTCLKGGTSLLFVVSDSQDNGQDVISFVTNYKVLPFINGYGLKGFLMQSRYYAKAWTGYKVGITGGENNTYDPMVYITKTGTVYHVDRGCTYLNPSIKRVSRYEVDNIRNNSGHKYTPCEICGKSQLLTYFFVTEEGDRAHSNINCSGLKRTIYTVRLSQVGGRGPCSKCS